MKQDLPDTPTRKERAARRDSVAPAGPSLNRTQLVPIPSFEEEPSGTGLPPLTLETREEPECPGPRALRIERKGTEPVVVALHPDRTYVFGRAPESSFVFPSDAVSRLHAQLRFADERWIYRDLNSRNGTYVCRREPRDPEGDPRLAARQLPTGTEHVVSAGDHLLLANRDSRLTFLEELPEELAPPVGASGRGTSPATSRLQSAIDVCAHHRLPVFLLGPSGTGKTYAARAIHERARMRGH